MSNEAAGKQAEQIRGARRDPRFKVEKQRKGLEHLRCRGKGQRLVPPDKNRNPRSAAAACGRQARDEWFLPILYIYIGGLSQAPAIAVSITMDRAHTRGMRHEIATNVSVWKEKRRVLKIKRDSLFKEYLKRPQDIHLSLEIKKIDDEIAECNHKEQEGNGRAKVQRHSTLVSS
jgi:hypothetical protein